MSTSGAQISDDLFDSTACAWQDALRDSRTLRDSMPLSALKELWASFNTPIDNDGFLMERFMGFGRGTPREIVWRWFERQNNQFRVGKIMGHADTQHAQVARPQSCVADRSVALDLNVFGADGVVCDTTTALLTVAQLSDIVDHATQLVLARRAGLPAEHITGELDDALSASGVLDDNLPAPAQLGTVTTVTGAVSAKG